MPPPGDEQARPLGSTFYYASTGEAPTYATEAYQFAAAEPWPPGHAFLDEFVVEGVLGRGGMGEVYRVRRQSTGEVLAVKRACLRGEDVRRSFLAELETWIDLPDHPHLVACRFFRTVGDEVVLFTDVATGGSLADWIAQGRLTALDGRLDVAIQVAWGLHAVHELGVVHQDVKPANVLMSEDGTARVADFGLARARAQASPVPGSSTG